MQREVRARKTPVSREACAPGGPCAPDAPALCGAPVPGEPVLRGTPVPGEPVPWGTPMPGEPVPWGTPMPGEPDNIKSDALWIAGRTPVSGGACALGGPVPWYQWGKIEAVIRKEAPLFAVPGYINKTGHNYHGMKFGCHSPISYYLLEYCGAFLALCKPYFFLSVIR